MLVRIITGDRGARQTNLFVMFLLSCVNMHYRILTSMAIYFYMYCCCLTASFQQTPAAGSQISLLSLPAKLQMFPPLLLKWEASPTQLIFWFSLVLTCPGDRLYPADPVLSKVQKMASGEGFSLFAFACLFTNCKENEFLVNNHLFQKWHSH